MRNSAVCVALLSGLGLLSSCQSNLVPAATPTTAANSAGTTPTALRGTRWLLRQAGNQPLTASPDKEIYLQLNAAEERAEGQAGCNRFRGSFTLPAAGELRFGPLLATKMACPDLNTETAFLTALNNARRYRISADTLYLHGESTATVLATLQAQRQ